jgi:hypothetical protein
LPIVVEDEDGVDHGGRGGDDAVVGASGGGVRLGARGWGWWGDAGELWHGQKSSKKQQISTFTRWNLFGIHRKTLLDGTDNVISKKKQFDYYVHKTPELQPRIKHSP